MDFIGASLLFSPSLCLEVIQILLGNKQLLFLKHPMIWLSDLAILVSEFYWIETFFFIIVDMLINLKKSKKLLLQFFPMFAAFWLKCPGLLWMHPGVYRTYSNFRCVRCVPSRPKTSYQCWLNVGPLATTLDQR